MRPRSTLVVAILALAACKPRQDPGAALASDASVRSDALEQILATIDGAVSEFESMPWSLDASADTGFHRDTVMTLADEDVSPAAILKLAKDLDAMIPGDTVTDAPRAKTLVIQLQVLAGKAKDLDEEQRAKVTETVGRVRSLLVKGAAIKPAEPPATKPEPPKPTEPPKPAVVRKRTVDRKELECAKHPKADDEHGEGWGLKIDGRFLERTNLDAYMMTEAHCLKSLETAKNDLVCVGTRSAHSLSFNGVYRISTFARIPGSDDFTRGNFDLCYDAVEASSPTQVCSSPDGKTLMRYQLNGARLQAYAWSDTAWRQCLAATRASR